MNNTPKTAVIISANDFLEHDFTLYNKAIFLGETASLVDSQPGWTSTVVDVTYQQLGTAEIVRLFSSSPSLLLCYAAVNQSRLIFRLADLARKVCPEIKILVFGRATTFLSHYFSRPPFNAVHVAGDRECAITSYMSYVDGSIPKDRVSGLVMLDEQDGLTPAKPGEWLAIDQWPTPALEKLPLSSYLEAQNRRRNIVDCHLGAAITTSKGCETRCNFCGCSEEEGLKDRVRPPEVLFEWIERNQRYLDESFHFYSANALADVEWIRKVHAIYTRDNFGFTWQGVTKTNTLNDEVVSLARECGMRKLSIGIEHISSKRERPLKSTLGELEAAADLGNKYNIRLVGLLMLGFPGQTVDDVKYILGLLKKLKIGSYRFTGYTPLQTLRLMSVDQIDRLMIERYDRRTFYSDDMAMSPKQFYEILISNGDCLL